jgi:hypothetical protein
MTHPAPTGDPVADALRLAREYRRADTFDLQGTYTALEAHLRSALAPRVALTEEQSRQRFEEFQAGRKSKGVEHRARLFDKLADGTYFDEAVQRHWWTWQNALHAHGITPPAGIGTGSTTP